MTENKERSSGGRIMTGKKTIAISLMVVAAAFILMLIIFKTEPKARRSGAVKKTAMLVDVVKAEAGDFQPVLSATGIIKPSRQVAMKPLVRGTVISLSENFIPGGFLKKGEVLIRVDPSDYRNILEQKKSQLSQAIADLNIEMGRQNVALKDYQLLAESLPDESKSLILREPQLIAAKARVDSARASVNQAELDLNRTVIKAPFEAHILSRKVNVGSQVSPGDTIGDIVGIDVYWVETTVPIAQLRWLEFPGTHSARGSEVVVHHRTAWKEGEVRRGKLFKLIGSLEAGTRLAKVLVVIADPLNRIDLDRQTPELILGSFVETRIRGRELKNILRIKREYIRKGNTVWVFKNGKLDIRKVAIILRDQSYAYIGAGMEANELIVTTNLSTIVQGAGLRVEKEKTIDGLQIEGSPEEVKIKNSQKSERP